MREKEEREKKSALLLGQNKYNPNFSEDFRKTQKIELHLSPFS